MSKKIKITVGKREFNDVITKALDYGVEKYHQQVEDGDENRDNVLIFNTVLMCPVLNGMNWALAKRGLTSTENLIQTALVIKRLVDEQANNYAIDFSQEISDEDILNDHKRKKYKEDLLDRIKQTTVCDKYQITMELDSQGKVYADKITVNGMISDLDGIE